MDTRRKPARLALEDGMVFRGQSFGARGTHLGEVVFNTSMTGYQEIVTDPSYAGQIVVMTAPHVGNTGVNSEDDEASRLHLRGFVVRECCEVPSSWRSQRDLGGWLAEHGVPGITGVDTRALTRRLRERGAMKGVLSSDPALPDADLVTQARDWPGLDGVDLVQAVTCERPYEWTEPVDGRWLFPRRPTHADGLHVVVYDFGVKRGMLRRLVAAGCRVTVVPARTSAADTLALCPDGVLLSNGPGDPAAVHYAVETVRQLVPHRVPIFGICLGHQILGLAFGGRTYRLKFGHHGGNQPVKRLQCPPRSGHPDGLTPPGQATRPQDARPPGWPDLRDDPGRVEISAHNHNFAVEPPPELELTHVNLNDQCCEGMRHRTLPIASVQYHPEACPGPHDGDPFFDAFVRQMRTCEVAR